MIQCRTQFAPAERDSAEAVRWQHERLLQNEALILMNAVPALIVVLNRQRQIVFGNDKFLALLADGDIRDALGKRPGEFLGCVHAHETPGGCGTTEFCSQCGAVKAILSGLSGREDVQECQIRRLVQGREEALDLRVSSAPFFFEGETFTIFTIADISHEKRRLVLESVFFHDVLNTLGGLKNLLEFLLEETTDEIRGQFQLVHAVSERLIEELTAQKQLLAAENRELKPHVQALNCGDVLRHLKSVYDSHDLSKGKRIVIASDSKEVLASSDPALLERVVGNMLKNALEASKPGETVTMSCRERGGETILSVRNQAVMPREIRLRVFHRSFSTKGGGRGLGTYGMKLLGESYLGGRVWFTSEEGEGTEFFIALPGGCSRIEDAPGRYFS